MVFFADDELYKVIQDKIKNDLGQVVTTYKYLCKRVAVNG